MAEVKLAIGTRDDVIETVAVDVTQSHWRPARPGGAAVGAAVDHIGRGGRCAVSVGGGHIGNIRRIQGFVVARVGGPVVVDGRGQIVSRADDRGGVGA